MKLIDVSKKYGEKQVFSHLDLEIPENKITAVMGESGVGKTTLLNIIAGNTSFEGKTERAPKKCSFVFQEDRLIPFRTVQGNLEFALGKGDYSVALEKTGLSEAKNKYPDQLSGGMCRRVALLRAFLFKSDAFLMDEPFSSLDVGTKYVVMDYFLNLWKDDGRTTVMVTHNPDEAAYLADRIIILGKGGKVGFNEENEYKKSGDKKDFADTTFKITSFFTENGLND